MAVKSKISNILIAALSLAAININYQPVFAQEENNINDNKGNENTPEERFINYDYRIKLQNESAYSGRNNKSLLNPDNNFASEKNYYNRAVSDLDAKLFLGKYFDLSLRDQVAWLWQEKEKFDETGTKNYLQELFLTARIYDTLIIDAGRENVISGVAYGWNPTDYMIYASISANPDPRSIRDQRLGAYLVKTSLFFKSGQVSALYAPKIEDVDTNKEVRQLYKITAQPFDNTMLELLYFRQNRNSFGSNLEITVSDDLIIHFEGSAAKGSDVVIIGKNEIDGYGNSYEFINRGDSLYVKSVAGINYTFPDLHSMIVEFYYNGEGYSKQEWSDLFSMLEDSGARYDSNIYEVSPGINPYNIYLSAANKMANLSRMSRYYLFVRLSKQNIFTENLNYALFSFINLYDKSIFLNFNPEYSFLNNFRTGIIASYYAGKKKSEFGMSPDKYTVLWYLSFNL